MLDIEEEKETARQWKAKIDEAWFKEVDAPVDPVRAYRQWEKWILELVRQPLRRGPELKADQRVRRYLLERATGLSASSVKNYVLGNHDQLGDARFKELQRIDEKLGFEPEDNKATTKGARQRRQSIQRIALVTELTDLPSLSFHQNVIRSVLGSAQHHNRLLVIHEVSRPNLHADVAHLVRVHKCDGLVFIRLTPNDDLCSFLANERIPVVTVHADMREYPSPPILANIYPRQKGIDGLLRGYVVDCLGGKKGPTVVVIHMPKENTRGSIRDERIDLLRNALASRRLKLKVVSEQVEDYHFRRAIEVYQKHPAADFYVCLADEIAVGIKHIFQAAAPKEKPDDWKRKILGFDNCLAPQEGIMSFNQHIEQIGPEVMKVFDRFFEIGPTVPSEWPPFNPTEIPVSLTPGG
jgi:DNA-binding LacI/PurR family transcriptional regulator